MRATSRFDSLGTGPVQKPIKLAHVVLRTNNFKPMVQFYKDFLGATASYENEYISFLTYDDEHHRIALIGIPQIAAKNVNSCGLEHVAFSFEGLEDLLVSYRQRKLRHGIAPKWCVNHGPTTSIYYQDPDGNMIETQADNFDTAEASTEFMMSKAFADNPIGTDFDPEDLIRRLRAGENEASLKRRVEIGVRGIADVM